MKRKLLFPLLLIGAISYAQVQEGNYLNGSADEEFFGGDVALSKDGSRMLVGVRSFDGVINLSPVSQTGKIVMYEKSSDTWEQRGKYFIGEHVNEGFGVRVDVSEDGNVMAGGAPWNFPYTAIPRAGAVRVYQYVDGAWIYKGDDIDGENAADRTGTAVTLAKNGDRIAVGTPQFDVGSDSNNGLIRVYDWDGEDWVQLGGDLVGDEGDFYGMYVDFSKDGNRMVTGSRFGENEFGNKTGDIKVYDWSGTAWGQVGSDLAATYEFTYFGQYCKISADGTRIVAAGYGHNSDRGIVKVYDWDGTDWSESFSKEGVDADEWYGYSVDLSDDGNILVVGNPYSTQAGSSSGRVFIYAYDGEEWSQIGDTINGDTEWAITGAAVSISGDGQYVAVGSPYHGTDESKPGRVVVYNISQLVLSTDEVVADDTALAVYPTLTHGIVNFSSTKFTVSKIQVYNVSGQLVRDLNVGAQQNSINISTLTSGVYFLKMFNDQGASIVKEVVRQ
ncbi:T9SS type A sorting domain-containing protein [Formosa algae]|uniref:T9SS type A sorting domain-containing protein n=1 Tax=Formosa algae TaxID=225843 RepID=UPI000CCE8B1D|nr:T9SS type A sorting domain-containing protein [Formosa algae]PNW29222.1 hypothetical protein BKP44_04575 [Formosa algae]